MKAFSFPLESIRLLRQQRERAAQQRYGRALAVCENAQHKLTAANEELAAGYKLLAEELGHASTIWRSAWPSATNRLGCGIGGAKMLVYTGTIGRSAWGRRVMIGQVMLWSTLNSLLNARSNPWSIQIGRAHV